MFNLEHYICLRNEVLFSKVFNLFTYFSLKLIFKIKMLNMKQRKA